MKWSELSPEQRDRLVHEQVMKHSPDEPCTGDFVPMVPEADGLYCTGCGAEAYWHDDQEHERPIPPHYTTDMNAAWRVVEKMKEGGRTNPLNSLFVPWQYHLSYLYGRPSHRDVLYDLNPEGICLAALKACGIAVV